MAEGTTQIGANGPILKLSDVLRGMMRGDVAVGIGVVSMTKAALANRSTRSAQN